MRSSKECVRGTAIAEPFAGVSISMMVTAKDFAAGACVASLVN